MNKIKDKWDSLTKKGKIAVGALGAILVLIILSYIV